MAINLISCKCGIVFDTEKANKELIYRKGYGDGYVRLYGFVCPVCKKCLNVDKNNSDFSSFNEEEIHKLAEKLKCCDIQEC